METTIEKTQVEPITSSKFTPEEINTLDNVMQQIMHEIKHSDVEVVRMAYLHKNPEVRMFLTFAEKMKEHEPEKAGSLIDKINKEVDEYVAKVIKDAKKDLEKFQSISIKLNLMKADL
jgi:ribosomal protein L22